MNYELVMLRGITYCKKSLKDLEGQCKRIALGSFDSNSWREGTWGQALAVATVSLERDRYVTYLNLLKQSLSQLPKGYRALLVAVYLKNISKEELCKKYNVSMSTVYRKLNKARSCFRSKLELLGCTEQWFFENFANIGWVGAMLNNPHNGSRLAL